MYSKLDLLFLGAVLLTLAFQVVAECRDHRTNGKCDQECYFDPHLTEFGRCQPCEEICSPQYDNKNECIKNIGQCNGTFHKYYGPTPRVDDVTTNTPIVPGYPILTVIAVVAGVVAAVLSLLAVIAFLLFRKHQNVCGNHCSCWDHCHVTVKPVQEVHHHTESKMEMAILGGVTTATPLMQSCSATLQRESVPQNQACDTLVWSDN